MKSYLVKALLSFSVLFTVFSCTEDNGDVKKEEMTPEESRVFIKDNLKSLTDCLDGYQGGAFGDFVYNYITHSDATWNGKDWVYPENSKQDWINDVIDQWSSQYGHFIEAGKKFNLAAKKGIYTWNSETHKFNKEDKGEALVIIAPSDRSETDLDLKLEVTKYVEQEISFSDKKSYVPSELNFALYEKKNKVFECIAEGVKFDVHTNFSMPISGKVKLYTDPVTHMMELKRETSTRFRFNQDITKEGGCHTSIHTVVNFAHDDYGNFTEFKKDVNTLDIVLAHNVMSIKMNVNVKEMRRLNKDLGDLTQEEFDSVVKTELFKQDKKVADVKLKDFNKDEEIKVTLTLSDGSKQEVTKEFKEAIERIKEVFKRFDDNEED